MRAKNFLLSAALLALVVSVGYTAQQTINVGTTANDGTGDTARVAFQKVNANFTELYGTRPISMGGTSATTAPGARTALGLTIGSSVQAWDADLDLWAGITPPAGEVVGTSDTQTLTGKTINGASNTLTVRLGSDVSGNLPVSRLNGGTNASASTAWFGDGTWKEIEAGSGTVTSVDLSVPSWLAVSGNPVTSDGTLAVTAASGQTANRFLATPDGSSGAVGLRAIVADDLPTVSLTTGISGILPIANGGTNAADAESARASLGVSIGSDVQAWDTDLDTWAGKTAPSGTAVGTSDSQTLTSKRINPRVQTAADGTSITPAGDTADMVVQANTQSAGTLTVNAPTGTPVDGQKLTMRISSTSVQTFDWDEIYRGSTSLPLPTASSGGGDYDYFGWLYNAVSETWDYVGGAAGF